MRELLPLSHMAPIVMKALVISNNDKKYGIRYPLPEIMKKMVETVHSEAASTVVSIWREMILAEKEVCTKLL